jgi:aspartate kinase
MIVRSRESTTPVVGIAGHKGFTMINIEKALMNRERGFGKRVLGILDDHGVSFEHMPTGIDTISLIVKDDELADHGAAILKGIERQCEPDRVTLVPGLALIATVGQGMNHHIGIAGRLGGLESLPRARARPGPGEGGRPALRQPPDSPGRPQDVS